MNHQFEPGVDNLDYLLGEAGAYTMDDARRDDAKRKAEAAALDRASPYYKRCDKCGGTGSWRGRGTCFTCKGAGGWMMKTTQHERDASRSAAAKRETDNAAMSAEGFAREYPGEHAWMLARAERFEFAASMLNAVEKYGYLTDKQLTAVRTCMLRDAARDEQRAADRSAAAEAAPVVADQAKLGAAFEAAIANGLKRPVLRFNGFVISLAKPGSKNPGAIYIKADNAYLGKVVGGRFFASPDYQRGGELAKIVGAAMADPFAAAKAYGRDTGSCSCCGRPLSDPESVKAGIGPICASKWGF